MSSQSFAINLAQDSQQSHPLVQIENLFHTYYLGKEKIQVLKQINLTINKGEFLAIMGPSGSGKSTLLHILGCLERPSQGKYWLNRRDVAQMNDIEMSSLRAFHIGFVFQSFNLIPHLNVLENVEIPFAYQSPMLPQNIIRERILKAIGSVKLEHRLYHLPSQLSGGECQRVAIARALAIQPLLILADEPTGNLDSETGKNILQIFQELNREGTTLVIVTHDATIAAHSQRIVRLQDGEIFGGVCSDRKF